MKRFRRQRWECIYTLLLLHELFVSAASAQRERCLAHAHVARGHYVRALSVLFVLRGFTVCEVRARGLIARWKVGETTTHNQGTISAGVCVTNGRPHASLYKKAKGGKIRRETEISTVHKVLPLLACASSYLCVQRRFQAVDDLG